jgi:hypothetical protein
VLLERFRLFRNNGVAGAGTNGPPHSPPSNATLPPVEDEDGYGRSMRDHLPCANVRGIYFSPRRHNVTFLSTFVPTLVTLSFWVSFPRPSCRANLKTPQRGYPVVNAFRRRDRSANRRHNPSFPNALRVSLSPSRMPDAQQRERGATPFGPLSPKPLRLSVPRPVFI